jgi:hypothetical protein
MAQTENGNLSMSSPETAHRLADQLQTYADRYRSDWSDATPILSWEDLAVVIDALRRCPAQPQPFGYLIEKAGVNNGYYWISPAEFEHVEERFRYLYKRIYEAAAAPAQEQALELLRLAYTRMFDCDEREKVRAFLNDVPVASTDGAEIGDIDKWEANRRAVSHTDRHACYRSDGARCEDTPIKQRCSACPVTLQNTYCALCDLEYRLHEDVGGFHHVVRGNRVQCPVPRPNSTSTKGD